MRTTSTKKVVHVIVHSRGFIICLHCQHEPDIMEEAETR
jgi:hypothetical protein